MIKIDVRGMSCPQPVLMVQKSVNKGESHLEILVDCNTAKDNVIRYLSSNGFKHIDQQISGAETLIKASK